MERPFPPHSRFPPFPLIGSPATMDGAVGSWDFVIKVKYGDTLKRFNVSVIGGLLHYDIISLRNKIVSLFQLTQDPELVLTYVDGDGEIVTMENDDELHDAVFTQHLNPLRINVHLKPKSGAPELKPDILHSIHSSQPNLEHTSQISSFLEETLKSVSEPLLSSAIKAAASTSPALASLVDLISNLGTTSGMSLGATSESDKAKGIVPSPATTGLSNPMPDNLQKHFESSQFARDGAAKTSSVDLNVGKAHSVEYPSIDDLLTSQYKETEETDVANCNGKTVLNPIPGALLNPIPGVVVPDLIDQNYIRNELFTGIKNKQFANGASSSSFDYNLQFPMYDDTAKTGFPLPSGFASMGLPFRRFHGHHDSLSHTFHRGVRCDGCGMHPIIGSRFKSILKDNYDLCNICFSQMGNEADYIRFDKAHPVSHRMSKEFNNPHSRRRFPPAQFACVGGKFARAKLESRFIQDVTVLDGTIIPSSTPFTKIWRMRNNGNYKWPYGTKLVWVGGDQFANTNSVQLEIQSDGFPENEEIDVAVDFTSPTLPGRYVSYWKLASPFGQKFGQRVWVLIQVDSSRPNSAASKVYTEINLNLPPESSNQNGLDIINLNPEPLKSSFSVDVIPPIPVLPKEPFKTFINIIPTSSPESASHDAIVNPASVVTPSEPYPVTEIRSSSETPLLDVKPYPEMAKDDEMFEQTLLKELEEMGFKQIDLNKEILRGNDYDLEQSVDDLCDFAEWDPLLTELRDMGFSDTTKNKKLLIKYDGSIKRVVMDLIAEEA